MTNTFRHIVPNVFPHKSSLYLQFLRMSHVKTSLAELTPSRASKESYKDLPKIVLKGHHEICKASNQERRGIYVVVTSWLRPAHHWMKNLSLISPLPILGEMVKKRDRKKEKVCQAS